MVGLAIARSSFLFSNTFFMHRFLPGVRFGLFFTKRFFFILSIFFILDIAVLHPHSGIFFCLCFFAISTLAFAMVIPLVWGFLLW